MKTTRTRRRGSVYLLVLATSSLVAIIGISGLLASRLARSSAALGADAVAAESLAHAGLVAAANRLGRDGEFAASPGDGWSDPVPLGEGLYRTDVRAAADAPGLHRVRVRAVVGDAVRVLAAEVREPPRLGPELLLNPTFNSGLHPTEARFDREVEAKLRRDSGGVYLAVEEREDSRDGVVQGLRFEPDPDARYRFAATVRMEDDADGVRAGLERRSWLTSTSTFAEAWVGTGWVEVTAVRPPPSTPLGGEVSFFVCTTSDEKDLHVRSVSLRRVLSVRPGEVVPGSLAWLPDAPEDRGLDAVQAVVAGDDLAAQ